MGEKVDLVCGKIIGLFVFMLSQSDVRKNKLYEFELGLEIYFVIYLFGIQLYDWQVSILNVIGIVFTGVFGILVSRYVIR